MIDRVALTFLVAMPVALTAGAKGNLNPSGDEWVGKPAPEIASGEWINSAPLKISELRGRVVLLEFWTYGCYNCRNTLPYVKEWNKEFPREQLQIIGVHTPEFEREQVLSNVQRNVRELEIDYAVVTDNAYRTWEAYNQRYWPVMYVIDKKGIIRHVQIGEGAYQKTEMLIRDLIAEE